MDEDNIIRFVHALSENQGEIKTEILKMLESIEIQSVNETANKLLLEYLMAKFKL